MGSSVAVGIPCELTTQSRCSWGCSVYPPISWQIYRVNVLQSTIGMSYSNQDDAVHEYSTELEMCLNHWQTLSVHVAMNVSAVRPIAQDYL